MKITDAGEHSSIYKMEGTIHCEIPKNQDFFLDDINISIDILDELSKECNLLGIRRILGTMHILMHDHAYFGKGNHAEDYIMDSEKIMNKILFKIKKDGEKEK